MASVVFGAVLGSILGWYAALRWVPALKQAITSWWKRTISALVLQGLRSLPEDARETVVATASMPEIPEEIRQRLI